MAEENAGQAIPPKVRPAGEGAEAPTVRSTPTPVPRTVRLKPISAAGGIPAAPSSPGLPPVTPSAPVGTEAAAEAIKRMTARIAMMADETSAKKSTGQIAAEAAGGKKATGSLPSMGGEDATVKKVTSRIQMPSTTVPIPAMGDAPKTIKIRPMTGTQPVSQVEPPANVGQSASQQVGGKSKTSRIPLESAMAVPQQQGAVAAEPPGGTPKTIKLKRPGEMSTIKVSVPGANLAPAASHAAGGGDDGTSPTQKKTIRVKRPMAPAAAPGSESAPGEPGIPTVTSMSPIAMAPAAPERGTGWFVALAVACILVAIGVTVVFGIQLYGHPPNTDLDSAFQKG